MTQAQTETQFYRYPPIGDEQWRYAFQTARVRALETTMLPRSTIVDMANADSFTAALDLLNGTDYAGLVGADSMADIEQRLARKREEVHRTFIELRMDEELTQLVLLRYDIASMRLALRRVVTDRPVGTDYTSIGIVPADELEEVFESEDYSRFPEYLQEAVERAVLAYYAEKDIRQIDYALDEFQAEYRVQQAHEIDSTFLESLFRLETDLTNIRTLLRLKEAGRDERNRFLSGGFLGVDPFTHALGLSYDAIPPLFFATPYHEIVEAGVAYLVSEKSFLRLESLCERYENEFLRTTRTLAAGSQPVIAFLLLRESEIRAVRMVLIAKWNNVNPRLIHDRLGD